MEDEKDIKFSEKVPEPARDFKKYKSKMSQLYSEERSLLLATGARKGYYDVSRLKDRDQVIRELETSISDINKAAGISEALLSSSGIYAEIIEYYINLPLYRYTVIPALMKKERNGVDSKEKYADVYNKMVAAADGISIEVVFPKILQAGLVYGVVFLYTDKDTSSSTVETFVLPNSYCKRGFGTNFGTETVVFDFKFFDDLRAAMGKSGGLIVDEEMFEGLFPAAMITQYQAFKKDRNLRFQLLEPKFSAAIPFSMNGMPPKIFANYGIVDYRLIQGNEIQRSLNELEKIFTHEIPHNEDGDLIFSLDESIIIHENMTTAMKGVKGLKLLTTFGKTNLLELQGDKTKENKSLKQAYENIYYNAGLNPSIFHGENESSINASITKDVAYIFKQLQLVINFYNVAINNLYSFTPYQAKLSMLSISIYDEMEKIKLYRDSASFGIGKLEAVVAAGIKQVDIIDKANLEKFLDLNNILVPLQSSHTQSGKNAPQGEKPQSSDKEEKEVKEVEDTNEVDTNE